MTTWGMRIACWIPKATNTHSEYVILIAFSTVTVVTRTRLNVPYTYIGCLVEFQLTQPLLRLAQMTQVVCRLYGIDMNV